MLVLGETYLIKNWENFHKKYKILGRFHKIKDQMLVSMTLCIFRGTSPSSGVQYTARIFRFFFYFLKNGSNDFFKNWCPYQVMSY